MSYSSASRPDKSINLVAGFANGVAIDTNSNISSFVVGTGKPFIKETFCLLIERSLNAPRKTPPVFLFSNASNLDESKLKLDTFPILLNSCPHSGQRVVYDSTIAPQPGHFLTSPYFSDFGAAPVATG